MMEKIIELLKRRKPEVDFEHETALIDKHILDSLSIMALVVDLNQEFDIEISPLDAVPENFQSAQAICEMVNRLREE